jgi:RDD family
MGEPDSAERLEDFPLHAETGIDRPPLLPAADPVPSSATGAPLLPRFYAAAADAAVVLLLTAIAILAARIGTGRSPQGAGLAWAIAFTVYLSAIVTVLPLVLFGRTIGMALSDLSVRGDGFGAGLDPAAALRRWAGTIATAATAGLLLLATLRGSDHATPADRFSGHTLSLD